MLLVCLSLQQSLRDDSTKGSKHPNFKGCLISKMSSKKTTGCSQDRKTRLPKQVYPDNLMRHEVRELEAFVANHNICSADTGLSENHKEAECSVIS
ncbi:unnamed protein product, partial [Pocillopora meandrina]